MIVHLGTSLSVLHFCFQYFWAIVFVAAVNLPNGDYFYSSMERLVPISRA
jgi:hypothetical protein